MYTVENARIKIIKWKSCLRAGALYESKKEMQ